MKAINHTTIATLLTALMMFAVGCNDDTSAPATNDHDAEHADADGHAGHDHPDHGPHEGDLIELGGDDYHAEIVRNDDEIVIYILGSDARTAIPIDAKEVVINAVRDDAPAQFKLAAAADEGDPDGKSSRFSSSDAELVEHVHDDDSEAWLAVTIEGKQRKGKIPHDHDHGHDH